MTAKVVHWRAAHVLPGSSWVHSYAVVDPDQHGAVVFMVGGQIAWISTLEDRGTTAKHLSQTMRVNSVGPLVLVVETQYVDRNAASAINVGSGAGEFVGMVAAYCDARVECVWLAPATWQSFLRREVDAPKGKLVRKQVKAYARQTVPEAVPLMPAWQRATSAQREGIADALVMARCWASRAVAVREFTFAEGEQP